MRKQLDSLILMAACPLFLMLPAHASEIPDETSLWQEVSCTLSQKKYEYVLPASSPWQFTAPSLEGRLSISQDGKTATLFAPNTSLSGGWTDTNKYWDGHDKSLCWAATASNMIDWYLDTVEQAGVTLEDQILRDHMDIFNQHFRHVWVQDEGYDLNNGLSWYFSGYFTNSNEPDFNPSASDNPDKKLMLYRHPGGFLNTLPHTDGAFHTLFYGQDTDLPHYVGNYGDQYPFAEIADSLYGTEGVLSTHQSFSDTLLRGLRYGVAGLTVKTENSIGGGHAVTLWGADFDIASGKIKRIYITDSDDHASTLRSVGIRARTPDQDGIVMLDYMMSDGTPWTKIVDAEILFSYGVVTDKSAVVPPDPECPDPWEPSDGGSSSTEIRPDGSAVKTTTFRDGTVVISTYVPNGVNGPSWQITSVRPASPATRVICAEYTAQGRMLHMMAGTFREDMGWEFPGQNVYPLGPTVVKLFFLDESCTPIRASATVPVL